MAKDGTNRGGRRVRAGDKPAPAAEKKQKGLPVKIISNDIPALDTAELELVSRIAFQFPFGGAVVLCRLDDDGIRQFFIWIHRHLRSRDLRPHGSQL